MKRIYEVEDIIASKIENNQLYYYIKWKNYSRYL